MTLLRNGWVVDDRRLDRLPSVRTDHLEKFPLTAATAPAAFVPVVAGVNWYSGFEEPEWRRVKGRGQWVLPERLGSMRGGHAVCLRPHGLTDLPTWWEYYDQGTEGRCVEFAMLRAMTLLNRVRYDLTSRWHYWQAQRSDEWPGGSYPGAVPHYEGTSVRAGLEVLRAHGPILAARRRLRLPNVDPGLLARPDHGISAYRWALRWQDVRRALGRLDSEEGVVFLNSWGRGYPRQVLMPDAVGERLLAEDGEFGVPTDR